MHNTYNLVCNTCLASFWIATGSLRDGDILENIEECETFRTNPSEINVLRDFFFIHMGHALQFLNSQDVPGHYVEG